MKRYLFAMATVAMGLTAMAQQALWGVPQIKSPEVNSDKTVTFRVMAPDAKEVKVTGDFLPTEKSKLRSASSMARVRLRSPRARMDFGSSPHPLLCRPSSTAIRSLLTVSEPPTPRTYSLSATQPRSPTFSLSTVTMPTSTRSTMFPMAQ